jgi:hypothetical protein
MQLGQLAGLKPAKRLREVFGDAILELCRRNPKVVILDGDLASTTKTHHVCQEFPERFSNTGIAESNMISMAAGLADCAFIPVATSLSSFILANGYDQLRTSAATADTVAESARRAGKDPFQVASYVDGTKTMFEMACAANATGCLPMKRGMVGPEATLETVSDIFALEEDGGIVKRPSSSHPSLTRGATTRVETRFPGVVDFVQEPSMSGGVFITVRIQDQSASAPTFSTFGWLETRAGVASTLPFSAPTISGSWKRPSLWRGLFLTVTSGWPLWTGL